MSQNFEIVSLYGVSCYEQDGTAYLRLEDVARGLGFTEVAASGNVCVKWTRVRKYLHDLGIDTMEIFQAISLKIFFIDWQ